MKSLLIAIKVVVLLSVGSQSTTEVASNASKNCVAEAFLGGYIVMEDDMMMLTGSNNTGDTIVQIDVRNSLNQTVFSSTGCSSYECLSDLSSLSTATYDVYVITDTGGIIAGSIQL
ncbi:MAG: hypothetical protein HRU41_04790 [Saprospiraceae bacterium]|nr:hypothetical protein [Saprospiraceae bacterium]